MVMHMGLAAFNRRRRELAAKQQKEGNRQQPAEKHTGEGGRKNGKDRKTKADSGD